MPFPFRSFNLRGIGANFVHRERRCVQNLPKGFSLVEILLVVVILAALAALVVSRTDNALDHAEAVTGMALLATARDAFVGSSAAPGYVSDMKFLPGFAWEGVKMRDLFSPKAYPEAAAFDPTTRRGWRGPYLRGAQKIANLNPARDGRFPAPEELRFQGDAAFSARGFFPNGAADYGEPGDPGIADAWGNPVVLQIPPPEAFQQPVSGKERWQYARLVSAGPDGILNTPRDRLAGRLPNGDVSARGDDLLLFLNRADEFESE